MTASVAPEALSAPQRASQGLEPPDTRSVPVHASMAPPGALYSPPSQKPWGDPEDAPPWCAEAPYSLERDASTPEGAKSAVSPSVASTPNWIGES